VAGAGGEKLKYIYASLRGKRLRLAYFLAPEFKPPLRKSEPVNLSTILTLQSLAWVANFDNSTSLEIPSQGMLQWEQRYPIFRK
jgi:hypothetical protein